jgi:chromosome segregation ATPase
MIISLIPLIAVDLPTIGGTGGLLAVIGIAIRETYGWLKNRKTLELTEKAHDVTAASASVADQATTASVMLDALTALQTENRRLQDLNQGLQNVISEKDTKIVGLQAEIERMMQRLGSLYETLEELRSSH